jgi:outer membrane protein TolC
MHVYNESVSAFKPQRFRAACLAILIPAVSVILPAQTPPASSAGGAARPIALPQSGRPNSAGSVSVQQSTSAGGVETINTSTQLSGNLQGSVPGAQLPAGVISLTLGDAIKFGLLTNLGIIAAGNASTTAAAQRIAALGALLPYISANAGDTVTQTNLAAFGFKFNLPPGLNFSFPTIVGPYNYSQAQVAVSESVYDPVARRNWRAAKELEKASQLSARDARELVVMAVAATYLQSVATSARIDSQRAQVANAQAVYDQAQVRKAAGTNARIDVMRTLVELQTQKQRLNALEADLRKQKLVLARIIGLPLDRDMALTEPLAPQTIPIPEPATAVQQALAHRSDLQAAEAQVRAAEHAVSAARAERLPSVSFNGDYGVLGPNPTQVHGVFTVTGSVNVPLWTGGRIRAEVVQAEAALHQRQAELADQRGRVEQEVRSALIELETATGQLQLAGTNRDYAAETLREARDRFNLGVTSTVEVVQAQEQVASAEADYVSSLFSLDVARLNLSRAAGEAEATLPELLRGKRP